MVILPLMASELTYNQAAMIAKGSFESHTGHYFLHLWTVFLYLKHNEANSLPNSFYLKHNEANSLPNSSDSRLLRCLGPIKVSIYGNFTMTITLSTSACAQGNEQGSGSSWPD